MFAATRVMAAGKAGLESLPYFVDELLAQGITQLAPWAADHNQEQIERLNNATQERRAGTWGKLYGIGASDLGFHMQPEDAATQRLLREINPHAENGLADSPAQLAVWCRGGIWQHCTDTFNLWERFKYDNGTNSGEKLAVVIPYCPEGPTSGTVGMYLGAALRKHFANLGLANELVVWGIELCPAIYTGEFVAQADRDNAFRGYVARAELLQGVPLSKDDPDDKQFQQPFDINIVIDGGTTVTIHDLISDEDIWKALDRVAAQTTACLLNGAAGGDVDESTNWLKQGKRWNAYLAHVASELYYNSACRYLRYRVRLPWHRNPEVWNKTRPSPKKDALLRRIDEDVRPMRAREKDSAVREKIDLLVHSAEQLRSIKKFLFLPRNKALREKLDQFIAEEKRFYEEICAQDYTPDRVTPKDDPFCINIGLPERLRREANERWSAKGSPDPIGDVLGVNGALSVRNKIEDLLAKVLKRSDYRQDGNSQAEFEQIIGISIEDRSRPADNEEFRPGSAFLRDFINVAKQSNPSSLNALTYNLSEYLQISETQDNFPGPLPKALGWRLPRHDDYDIPVEYSFLALARCRRDDGFSDVSTYEALKGHYDKITGDSDEWRMRARYYGVKPPPEMEVDCPDHPEKAPALSSGRAYYQQRAREKTSSNEPTPTNSVTRQSP